MRRHRWLLLIFYYASLFTELVIILVDLSFDLVIPGTILESRQVLNPHQAEAATSFTPEITSCLCTSPVRNVFAYT